VVGSLFDEPDGFDRDLLAEKLRKLAEQKIFIGGSSWKYEGWLGQIYSRERYLSRGKFSRQAFERECLREYAETFPIVCGDFAFYQFPSEAFWRDLFGRVPEGFQFAFKVPEQITCKVYPAHARYGPHSGKENDDFLSARMMQEMFLRPLMPYRDRIALLILEFGTFSQRAFEDLPSFLDRLDPFLASLPQDFRYAVEVRNAEFLAPDYFSCLRNHRVAHVYNAWTRMPELRQQMAIPDSETTDFLVSRALLRFGRSYEQAVATFQPYSEIRDPNPEARASMRALIGRAKEKKETLIIFVNNRFEGNSPRTILSLVEEE
jgi:uncharacterized protein YecE (DUF72 family)